MLIYLHGFNSSPASHKARLLRARMDALGREGEFLCPALPHRPAAAMRSLVDQLAPLPHAAVTLVGSSLGGYYATYLAEQFAGMRAVLVNPAITPATDLAAYLGAQRNLYTNERYELTPLHLDELRALYIERITDVQRYLLIHATGDELLDYRIAQQRYHGARQIIHEGGDHGFADFERYVDDVLAFAGLV